MRSSSPGLAQLVAAGGGAAVLPDERAMQRLARRRVPADDGLALVGDADRLELAGLQARVVERLAGDRVRDVPDLRRVVLDPAGLREVLRELAVGAADALPLQVEHQAGRAGRPLVDREQHAAAAAYLLRMPTLAVSAVGLDRPGIIAGVAERLAAHGANITDSRMAILRGHFAMTLIVRGRRARGARRRPRAARAGGRHGHRGARGGRPPALGADRRRLRPRRRPPGHRRRRHARARGRGRQRLRPPDAPRARRST